MLHLQTPIVKYKMAALWRAIQRTAWSQESTSQTYSGRYWSKQIKISTISSPFIRMQSPSRLLPSPSYTNHSNVRKEGSRHMWSLFRHLITIRITSEEDQMPISNLRKCSSCDQLNSRHSCLCEFFYWWRTSDKIACIISPVSRMAHSLSANAWKTVSIRFSCVFHRRRPLVWHVLPTPRVIDSLLFPTRDV